MQTETRSIHTFQEGEIFDSRYRLVKRAGSGGFADVWKAEDTLRKNKVVALKIYTRLDEEGIKEMSDEYDKTEDLLHPNLLTGNHFAAVGNIPYLEMRYCDGGSLVSRVGRIGNDELRHMLRDIAGGLAYLHKEGVVHQDIKPENILLDTKHDRYMLADFGISGKSRSRLSKSAKMASELVAMTAAYAPPEKLSSNPMDREPSTKGDIFSLGVTLYELATGNLPVDLPQSTGQLLLISQGRQPLYFDNIADPQLRQIVQRCMSYRKEDRPTAEEVLAMIDGKNSNYKANPKTEQPPSPGYEKPPTEKIHVNPSGTASPNPPRPPNPPTQPNRKWIYVVLAAVVVTMGVTLTILTGHSSDDGIGDNTRLVENFETPNTSRAATSTTATSSSVETFTANGVSFNMVRVEGGSTGTYYIGETEVTQALWQAVMGNNPSNFKGTNRPVEQVSWYDCKEFIRKLNALTGKEFRLPKESEWEYAAKGGNKSHGYTYSGCNSDDALEQYAWYDENAYYCGSSSANTSHPDYGTHAVKQKRPNELGIYDMSGNVWEWCEDLSSSSGSNRVFRGGGWGGDAGGCSVSYPGSGDPSTRNDYLGFRLALSAR